jgi:Protein of unknown function (DUF1761)
MDVNWWAIIVAAIVKFVIGGIWYMPLFGKQYRALMGVPEGSDMAGLAPALGVQFVGDLVMSYILARFIIHYGASSGGTSLGVGILIGFMAWLGFVAAVTVAQRFFERRPWALWAINNGYLLISMVVMGAILGWWHAGAAAARATAAAG